MFLGVLWPPGSCVACPHAQRGHSCLPTRSCSFRVCFQLFCWLCLVGGVFFLIALFSPWLELRCRALRCYWLSCWVRCGLGGRSSGQNSEGKQLDWLSLKINWSLWMRSTLVWIGLPSLLNSDAYFVFKITGAPWGNGRLKNHKTLFHPFLFLVFW